jgi:FOG: Ankyrin repeat
MAILFISYFMILHIIWISLFLAGNMDKLKLALKCTDIDTVDEMSRTALHFAITQRHTNIVWFLLNNKARMDIMDKDGFTAFHKVRERKGAAFFFRLCSKVEPLLHYRKFA